MTFADNFWELVAQAGSVVITSHKMPDDDAIASVLAVNRLVKEEFPDKQVEMIITGVPEDGRYAGFAGFSRIRFCPDLAEETGGVDLLILTDGCEWRRFSHRSEELKSKFKGKSICIDHHGTAPEKFDLIYTDPAAASCTDIIYRVFLDGKTVPTDLVRIILLGILGDSGNFMYLRPDQMAVWDIGRKLLTNLGKNMEDFYAEYATVSRRVMELTGKLMIGTEYYEVTNNWPAWQWAGLDREQVDNSEYSEEEVSQAAHLYTGYFLRRTTGYQWGVVMTPRGRGEYNLSLRSLTGSVNVRRIVERMGIGGGMDRSAGGTFKPPGNTAVSLTEAKTRWMEWLKENRPEE